MKKKSPSQSAFFNLRVLIGLAVFLSGVCLALAGLGTFSKSNAPSQSKRSTKAPAAKSAAHTSFSHSLGTMHVEYSSADKDGRFRYMIELPRKECPAADARPGPGFKPMRRKRRACARR
jgi:hypothetical protein